MGPCGRPACPWIHFSNWLQQGVVGYIQAFFCNRTQVVEDNSTPVMKRVLKTVQLPIEGKEKSQDCCPSCLKDFKVCSCSLAVSFTKPYYKSVPFCWQLPALICQPIEASSVKDKDKNKDKYKEKDKYKDKDKDKNKDKDIDIERKRQLPAPICLQLFPRGVLKPDMSLVAGLR